ncbi:oxidoreductase [Puteibacter caeruleilacunae]|nr:oxidoreductase [Puteibacter caeruleilacunae]
MDNELRLVRLTSNTEIADGVFVITFKRDFEFTAGQVIGISIEDNTNNNMPRLYSIASGEDEAQVTILFNIKDDGWLTPQLATYKAGDAIYITAPSGSFVNTNEPAHWIAAGTGIAPFRSMLRSGLTTPKTLIQGGRFKNSFYFEDEFKVHNQLKYIRCCSQENDAELYSGRLTVYLKEQSSLPSDQKYYLCGSPEMVVEVRDILISKHIPYENIIAEIYF